MVAVGADGIFCRSLEIPIIAFGNCIPLGNGSVEWNACQTAAIPECVITNDRYAVGNRNARQAIASNEWKVSNERYCIGNRICSCSAGGIINQFRDCFIEQYAINRDVIRIMGIDHNACQTVATGERVLANARHSVRNRNACQADTALKCSIFNDCYRAWNRICSCFSVGITNQTRELFVEQYTVDGGLNRIIGINGNAC